MTPLPLEDLGATPGERSLLRRVYLVIAAVLLGVAGGAYATTRISNLEGRVGGLERYVEEERDARCAVAQNVYALCLRTGVDCLPVSATCAGRRGWQDSRGGR